MGSMTGGSDLFPDTIPWLSQDEKFMNGVECGALLMLCQMGAPLVKLKIHSINEDQIRTGASAMNYHVMVDKREGEWVFLTLATKTDFQEMTSESET